jgi:hypothetical protein
MEMEMEMETRMVKKEASKDTGIFSKSKSYIIGNITKRSIYLPHPQTGSATHAREVGKREAGQRR